MKRQPQVDALSDAQPKLKMIVALMQASHFSCYYPTWFSDSREDKVDVPNTEERQQLSLNVTAEDGKTSGRHY